MNTGMLNTAPPEVTVRYLQTCLQTRVSSTALDWLLQQCSKVKEGCSLLVLYTAFSTAPKRLGKAALLPSNAEIEEAQAVRPHWQPGQWTVDQAARCMLLLSFDPSDADRYRLMVEKLFSTAAARELVALYTALPLLPHQECYRMRAAEGVRSNMLDVFHAVALNNPYPCEQFDEAAWNQMVLKVAFTGSPMHAIVGLKKRTNAALARMLLDLAHERHSAGRSFPEEVWPVIASCADAAMQAEIQRLAKQAKRESQHTAIADTGCGRMAGKGQMATD